MVNDSGSAVTLTLRAAVSSLEIALVEKAVDLNKLLVCICALSESLASTPSIKVFFSSCLVLWILVKLKNVAIEFDYLRLLEHAILVACSGL